MTTLYIHVHFWPDSTPAAEWLAFFRSRAVVGIGGLRARVKSARLFGSGQKMDFRQNEVSVQFTCLPEAAPYSPVTVIEAVCDSVPEVDGEYVREHRQRFKVGVDWS